jgi:hypothetical protein
MDSYTVRQVDDSIYAIHSTECQLEYHANGMPICEKYMSIASLPYRKCRDVVDLHKETQQSNK